jgi:hypothetical protein
MFDIGLRSGECGHLGALKCLEYFLLRAIFHIRGPHTMANKSELNSRQPRTIRSYIRKPCRIVTENL